MPETKLERLITDTEGLIARIHDHLRQMKALAAGENPVGEVIGFWKDAWKFRHGSDYDLSQADAGNIKRQVTRLGAADLKERLKRYLGDSEPFLMRQKHPLSIFWSRVNTYSTPTTAPQEMDDHDAPPSGCQHTPACRTDAEHTVRKMREMRA